MTELGDVSSLFIVHCVFNGFLSYTCTMLNIATIHALRKTPSLPMTLKALLLSLSASDLGVGLIVQPLYIVRLVMIIGEETQTQTYNIIKHMFLTTRNLFSWASFLGVVALAADRFLAIHFHLRYQELVTHKRVVALMTSIWIFSSFLSFLSLSWIIPQKAKSIFFSTTGIFCIITTALFYWKIYLSARHHIIEINRLQVRDQAEQNGEVMANTARQRRSAVGAFYVFLLFLACYLPMLCVRIAELIIGLQNTLIFLLLLNANTLVFLNSSLNPLIYSWKMRHIRRTIMNLLTQRASRNLLAARHLAKRSP